MFVVYNEFADRIESRHRSAIAAYQFNCRLQRQVKKWNGPTSYIPVSFKKSVNGQLIPIDIYEELGNYSS
jgi:hypothetical protein